MRLLQLRTARPSVVSQLASWYPDDMPKKHWVLVAERRGKPTSQRRRQVVYVTQDKLRADRDVSELAQLNKKMRYYVMKYDDAIRVVAAEIRALDKALSTARKLLNV